MLGGKDRTVLKSASDSERALNEVSSQCTGITLLCLCAALKNARVTTNAEDHPGFHRYKHTPTSYHYYFLHPPPGLTALFTTLCSYPWQAMAQVKLVFPFPFRFRAVNPSLRSLSLSIAALVSYIGCLEIWPSDPTSDSSQLANKPELETQQNRLCDVRGGQWKGGQV